MYECLAGRSVIMKTEDCVNENLMLESCDCGDRRISSRGQVVIDETFGGG
jgi:hypothetical protein